MTDVAKHWDGPGIEAWRAWAPSEVTRRLAGAPVVWCVVGGWAIDLFLGHQTREHDDLEIATVHSDLPLVRRQFAGLVFHSVGDGMVHRLDDDEVGPPEHHQHWVLDETAGFWRVDVMVEPGDTDRWVFRRNHGVSAPRSEMIGTTAEGIPYLKPHGVLLYKAKAQRDKDHADFDAVLDAITATERRWLRDALSTLHPGHTWLSGL